MTDAYEEALASIEVAQTQVENLPQGQNTVAAVTAALVASGQLQAAWNLVDMAKRQAI